MGFPSGPHNNQDLHSVLAIYGRTLLFEHTHMNYLVLGLGDCVLFFSSCI